MKLKKIILLFIFVLLNIYFIPLEKVFAAEKNPSVKFDITLTVDKNNMVIKYLKEGTTVANLLNKITVNNGSVAVYDKSNLEKTSGKMKTSDKLVVFDTDNVLYSEYTISVLGDVSGDSNVNIHDVNRLFKYYKNANELSPESVEAGNVKMTGGYNIITKDDFVAVGKEKTFQEIDYGISPKDNTEITLADVAKLYQYSQGKIELINVDAWTGVSEDNTIVNANGNNFTGINKGTTIVNITGETSNDTGSIVVKTIPDVEPIDLSQFSQNAQPYQESIILRNELRNTQTGMQDFDIVNFGDTDETFYFVSAYRSLYSGFESITNAEANEALTTMIYKVFKDNLNNQNDMVANARIMYVKNAGQGQWISKEPSGNYFWTSGGGEIICSGADCSYDSNEKSFYCSDDKNNNGEIDCTWWGGNNSNITRNKFHYNSFGDNIEQTHSYKFGDTNAKNYVVWATFDWDNKLMAVIYKNIGKIFVYDTQNINNINNINDKVTLDKEALLYEIDIPADSSETAGVSIQGYAINGGYIYRLRGNHTDGIWIEQLNILGEYVQHREFITNQQNNRCEAQGLKIINNKIFFGVIYRNGCNWKENGNKCADGAMNDLRNSIYYLK